MIPARSLLAAALLAASPAVSQDLVKFDASSFGKVILKRDRPVLEPIAAGIAFEYEPMSSFPSGSVPAQIGRSVGRLDVATDGGLFPCTAFLVDDDLLMTNHHCVPGITDNPRAGATKIVGVHFVAGYVRGGVTENAETFTVNPVPVETSKALDHTLLRVIDAQPGRDFGSLPLSNATPRDHEWFWIIGHPLGAKQYIIRERCFAKAPALSDQRLLHTCPTLPGYSGSPVIDVGTRQVIALHHAGTARYGVNRAVPMSAILANSAFLTPAAPAQDLTGAVPQDDGPGDEVLALRALRQLGAEDDPDIFESGLTELIATYPDTVTAKSARRWLERLRRDRQNGSTRSDRQ